MGKPPADADAPEGRLRARVRDSLADAAAPVGETRMFGGTTFLLNGNMLCCVSRGGLMVRVGAAGEPEALSQPFAKPCLGTGRRMTGFVVVGFDGLDSKTSVAAWLNRARRYVEALPPKPPKSSRSAPLTARASRPAPPGVKGKKGPRT